MCVCVCVCVCVYVYVCLCVLTRESACVLVGHAYGCVRVWATALESSPNTALSMQARALGAAAFVKGLEIKSGRFSPTYRTS